MSGRAIRVAFFLAIQQIRHASIWTTTLVVFIMMLTFLNLVVVSGILVGLIEGAAKANREQYTGDIILTTPESDSYISNTHSIVDRIENLPDVEAYTVRYATGGIIEANYRERRNTTELADTATTNILGINPIHEDQVTGLGDLVVEGEYLEPDDDGYILLGALLLERNLQGFGNTDFSGLSDVYPGDKVRVTLGEATKEFTIKGIVDAKGGEIALRAYMVDRELRAMTGRTNQNANEISVTLHSSTEADDIKLRMVRSGIEEDAVIETWEEAQGQFLQDIKDTFNLLGTIIGSIGLLVASITIFIIVFINALSRRKFIGILKGIGISEASIELSYVLQSIFYAAIGSALGLLITYFILIPYIAENPIDFPFSDGILVAPLDSTLIRLHILILVTIIAGFIPARMIVRRNTLDAILGR